MARKNPASKRVGPNLPGSQFAGWGGETKNIHVPSGQKLIFKEDEAGLLKFIGQKDISDKLGEPEGSVIYLTFYDGKRIVSMPTSYAFTNMEFESNCYYIIHMAGELQTRPDFNPMKDFFIKKVGEEGETIEVDEAFVGKPTMVLNHDNIAELNYEKFNYPLRAA